MRAPPPRPWPGRSPPAAGGTRTARPRSPGAQAGHHACGTPATSGVGRRFTSTTRSPCASCSSAGARPTTSRTTTPARLGGQRQLRSQLVRQRLDHQAQGVAGRGGVARAPSRAALARDGAARSARRARHVQQAAVADHLQRHVAAGRAWARSCAPAGRRRSIALARDRRDHVVALEARRLARAALHHVQHHGAAALAHAHQPLQVGVQLLELDAQVAAA